MKFEHLQGSIVAMVTPFRQDGSVNFDMLTELLERQIAALPIGYISKKTINGKTRYYHQWTENGKKHSQYLRDGELEPLQEQIE